MANTISSLKRVRIEARRATVNRMRKSRLRHQVRLMRRLLDGKDAAGATSALPQTFSLIDRSARWGLIKKNTAARYKSRITLRLRGLSSTVAA